MRRTLVALVGVTASGKTAVGERVAEIVRGAVVCADARQVFRELELGTGKPTPAERARLLRALELVTAGGRPLASWRECPREAPLAAEWRTFQLTCPPATLAARIAARTQAMWEQGLLEEVRGLVAAGKADALKRLAAIGYDEALDVLEGRLSGDAARERTNQRTR